MAIIHTSAYKFIPLEHLEQWQQSLTNLGQMLQIKGTILLSFEGINIAIAGEQESITQFKDQLEQFFPLKELFYKDTLCSQIPYQRLMIKIKNEIIAMERPMLDYSLSQADTISPHQLKEWYEQEIDFDIIDTRNDYETKIGTFENAVILPLRHFRRFPEVISSYHSLKNNAKPKVIFCTGGVRCEKALPAMKELGFEQVYQLEGGILNYLKECGSEHYEGECFVFDDRISLNGNLQETKTILCPQCQYPLTEQEQIEKSHFC